MQYISGISSIINSTFHLKEITDHYSSYKKQTMLMSQQNSEHVLVKQNCLR